MDYKRFELLFWVLLITSWVCCSTGFTPADNYLINCGSNANSSVGSRVFVADNFYSKVLSTPQDVLANYNSNSISTLYQTARIFTGSSKYTFSISKGGRHWIRLYFYPFVYSTYHLSAANFSVSTQNNVLLSKYVASNDPTMKEFSVNVTSSALVIAFTPSNGSFAFLNAIEVVSVPDLLIPDATAETFNPSGQFQAFSNLVLETVHRINMGGPAVTSDADTLWRTWISDANLFEPKNGVLNISNIPAVNYVAGVSTVTEDIAPKSVYGTLSEMNTMDDPNSNFNVSWKFDVDPGFLYLVRFHYCDIVSKSLHTLYFNVYINSWLIDRDLDLSLKLNALGAPYYRDAIIPIGTQNTIRVSIGRSFLDNVYPNAILNGLEIMKMNNSAGSLGADSSIGNSSDSGSKIHVGVIVGATVGVFAVTLLVGTLFILCRRRRQKLLQARSKTWVPLSTNGGNSLTMGSKYSNGTIASGVSNYGYRIPFATLQECTNNFDESWVIGIGGFGKVYKGVLSDGTKVAVKRGNPKSQQGLAEFQTEIEMLSQFRHRHLVSLIGYCDERNEMILVYEYMENGTLKSHLYGSGLASLSWKERLEVCIGAARGLHYLHTSYAKPVIHRDVKSANILLDENLMAKVADFGLSKAGPEIDQTHVSTAVKGSFGYLDPEYFRRQQLTEKSDVYSFGVVLFEVICARPVIDPSLPREMVNLAEWAMKWQKRGQLDQIIDSTLVGKIKPDSLRKFGETAEKCLADYGVDRPAMSDVLWNLEYALQLQQAVIEGDPEDNSTNMIGELSPQVNNFNQSDVSVSATQLEVPGVDDLSGVSMSRVFSQLVKSEGR